MAEKAFILETPYHLSREYTLTSRSIIKICVTDPILSCYYYLACYYFPVR